MGVIFRVFNIVLVVFISILASVTLVLSQGDALTRSMTQYPATSRNLIISGTTEDRAPAVLDVLGRLVDTDTVSYTHLTLPTSDLV